MIITRTPLRITFVGGGTDIPAFYEKHGGACVNATINKYVTVTVREHLGHPRSLHSDTVKAALEMTGVSEVYVEIEKDISVQGLGTSSAICVGLLKALYALKGKTISPYDLASQAHHLEREILQRPGGLQDQYAAAYGGVNYLTIGKGGQINVFPQGFGDHSESMLLFDSGVVRHHHEGSPHESLDENVLKATKMLVDPFLNAYYHENSEVMGYLLAAGYSTKKRTHKSITTEKLEAIYNVAQKSGVYGGKLLGGGGGGAFLFIAPIDAHESIISELNLLRCKQIPFNFESLGSHEIIPTEPPHRA